MTDPVTDPATASVTDPATDAAAAGFRLAVGQFASGVVVVTTSGGQAAAVSAFASVSLEPPLVLFCVAKTSPFHDAVLAAGEWAVSIMADDAEPTARWLTNSSPPSGAQLDGIPHHPAPVTGAPLLAGALATLECRTDAVHDGGDHTIIIGRVLAASTPNAAAAGTPLLRYAGAYRCLRPLD